ncbi:hypothetical protein [Flavobacterium difficile]|uniref:Outer membrane protein n=1 Tax=Flavobacterium difficile TaxID=2709659 RepID=A0ABX0I7I5_9FLAO|nr:hypothetical protein [Flavobacterium difficile]NHM01692.1 hypothetical protein [Flavobacterium difficile]
MIKKITLIVALLLVSYSFAQENTSSPYSFYGIGTSKFKGTNDIISMGGISVYSDSTHVNVLNPASYSNQLVTTFQLGLTSSFYKLNSGLQTEKAQKTTFDYFVLGFPISKKAGVSLGLLPQSAVGYRFVNDRRLVDNTLRVYQGEGGVNKVYLGTGYKITPKLSFGFDVQYLFGSINTEAQLYETGVQFGSREINQSSMSGIAFNSGLSYQTKLNSKLNFMSSLTYSPEAKLTSSNARFVSLVTLLSTGGGTPASSDIEVAMQDTKLNVPSKLAFGAGLGNRKWFLGGDVTFSGTGNQVNRFDNFSNVSYENATKVSFGGFYIPKFDSYNSFFERVVYRAGFRFENTGLVINNTAIKDKALNLGFGLPIAGTFSSLNLGFEYGQRGTVLRGLVREEYFSVNLGLIFNDRWFRKTLYN